jgi:hypothetical protein
MDVLRIFLAGDAGRVAVEAGRLSDGPSMFRSAGAKFLPCCDGLFVGELSWDTDLNGKQSVSDNVWISHFIPP